MSESHQVHVVAGVIEDARGRILLARRTEGRDLAGLWEFPGGKVDPGETPEHALARELREELGIVARLGDALIRVPQQYPHKRLLLDVRRIAAWEGAVRGLDGQALAWVPPHMLRNYPMPGADRPVVAALRDPALYLITPEPGDDDAQWLAGLERALANGIRRVQLRSRDCPASRWRALVESAVARCRAVDAEVLINGDVDLAHTLDIGLHLRASQLATYASRPLADDRPLIASCHDAEELSHAEALACDAAVLGPVRPTATHPGMPGIGWEAFAGLRERATLPIYAIGGLGADDIALARLHGAQGVAAIRGLWPGATDT